MNYTVIFEDNDLLIIDKPQGLPTGFGNENNLTQMVFNENPDIKKVKGYNKNEGGLLNRLDNDTGGLVLFAKNDISFRYYSVLLKNNEVIKTYIALCENNFIDSHGVIESSIVHKNNKKMKVIKNKELGQSAKTEWKILKVMGHHCLVEVKITKGVRHQIRLHLSSIGSPIVGDKIYNKKQYQNILYHKLFAVGLDFINMNGEDIKVFIQNSDLLI